MNQLRKQLVSVLAVSAMSLAYGCAGKSHIAYELDCRANQTFDKCGLVFDTEYDCKAALNEMIREGATIHERGTCLKVHPD